MNNLNEFGSQENMNGDIFQRFIVAQGTAQRYMTVFPQLRNTPEYHQLVERIDATDLAYMRGERTERHLELYISAVIELVERAKEESASWKGLL